MKFIRKPFCLLPCLLPCLMLLSSIAYGQTKAPNTKIYRHEAFQLRVPSEIAVTKKMPADFDILSLKRGKASLMGAYVGGHPSFPSDDAPANASATHFKLDGLDAKFLRWQNEKGLYNGETLVTINRGWARVIHFYYRDLSQADAAISETIIRSLRLSPKQNKADDEEIFVPVE